MKQNEKYHMLNARNYIIYWVTRKPNATMQCVCIQMVEVNLNIFFMVISLPCFYSKQIFLFN